MHFDLMNKITSKDLEVGLSKMRFSKDKLCDAFQMGKQTKISFKLKKNVSTSKTLELLHLDLFGPSRAKSLGGNHYGFIIVDDYYRFTLTLFSNFKEETFKAFVNFVKGVQNLFNFKIVTLRSDRVGEFVNHKFENFCNKNGITHDFSCLRTPWQNGVVEYKMVWQKGIVKSYE